MPFHDFHPLLLAGKRGVGRGFRGIEVDNFRRVRVREVVRICPVSHCCSEDSVGIFGVAELIGFQLDGVEYASHW